MKREREKRQEKESNPSLALRGGLEWMGGWEDQPPKLAANVFHQLEKLPPTHHFNPLILCMCMCVELSCKWAKVRRDRKCVYVCMCVKPLK